MVSPKQRKSNKKHILTLLTLLTFFFVLSSSSNTTFTTAYSIRERNTKTVQLDMKISIALIYETGGKEAWLFACCVDRVRRLVTPRVTRAGTASGYRSAENLINFWIPNFNITAQKNKHLNSENTQILLQYKIEQNTAC